MKSALLQYLFASPKFLVYNNNKTITCKKKKKKVKPSVPSVAEVQHLKMLLDKLQRNRFGSNI